MNRETRILIFSLPSIFFSANHLKKKRDFKDLIYNTQNTNNQTITKNVAESLDYRHEKKRWVGGQK